MLKIAKLITNPQKLNTNDFVDWSCLDIKSELSPEFPPPFPEFSHQIAITSERGLPIEVSLPQGKLVRVNQNSFFPGTFDVGDFLLFTGFGNPGPLVFNFANKVYGFGINIQSDPQVPSGTQGPFPFSILIKVLNECGQNIGDFNLQGLSEIKPGSGATFLGLFHEGGEIAQIVINVLENGVAIPFAINMPKIATVSSVLVS